MRIRKSRRQTAPPAPESRRSVEERLAWAAGSERFDHRDPLYHVTENFKMSFDRMGRKHAREAAGADPQKAEGFAPDAHIGAAREPERADGRRIGAGREPGAGKAGGGMLWTGNTPSKLTEFSQTTFQRGKMFASVLNGTGKMMLVSCLKRTVGQSGPKRLQEQTLLGTGSQLRNIPGRSPDQMAFNRSFAKGALGVVVDTIRDARRVADSMTDMIQGTGELDAEDNVTLRTMYPFLDVSRERQLEAEYRGKLAACADEREKPVLQNALVQTLALKAKKEQMKNEFINKLRFVSDRATETLADLEAPGALDEIVASVWGDRTAEAGVEDGRGGGAEGDAPIEPEDGGAGPEDGEGQPPDGGGEEAGPGAAG